MWGRAKFAKMLAALGFHKLGSGKVGSSHIGKHGHAQITARKSKRNGKHILTESRLIARGLMQGNRNLGQAQTYAQTHLILAKGTCFDKA